MKDVTTLEFESPQFLHSLFANDLELLKLLDRRLQVRSTTRDGWLKFEGAQPDIDRASGLMRHLEDTRRRGTDITAGVFKLAVESLADNADDCLDDVRRYKLTVSSTKAPVVPKTQGQIRYLHGMLENEVVFGVGPAGTGKTFLAVAKALAMLRARQVERLILTRPAVEAGEALGFLPGDLNEKIYPYLRPLYDALHEMLNGEELNKLLDRGIIEIAPLAYMRGRTLNKCCVILDEAQNTTCEQMFMFLTRLGSDSKCLITGDPSQIDLKPRVRSGLHEAMEFLGKTQGVFFHVFESTDVVRHPVVQRIIEAYSVGRTEDRHE